MHACPSVRRQQSKTPKFKFALYIGIPGGGGARVARAVATIPKPVDQPNSKPKFSQISAKSQISVKSRRHGARCHTDACIVADPQITLCRPYRYPRAENCREFAWYVCGWASGRSRTRFCSSGWSTTPARPDPGGAEAAAGGAPATTQAAERLGSSVTDGHFWAPNHNTRQLS